MVIKNDSMKAPDHIVEMTEAGFVPENLIIKKGETVQWVNKESISRWPASNLHPTHGIYPEFDPQEPISPNESWSFEFLKTGEWKYHDHLKPLLRGVIVVQE